MTTPNEATTAPPEATTSGESSGGNWYDGFQDASVRDWIKAYNGAYPNPEAVAIKAYNLEKFLGAEKSGRGVIAPKPDAPAEEVVEFFRKIGVAPSKAEAYTVPEAMAQDPMMAKFRDLAYQSGVTPQAFSRIVDWYSAEAKTSEDRRMQEFETKAEEEWESLRQDWAGVKFDKNVEMARRAAKMFIPHDNAEQLEEILTRMEGALGTKTTMKLWASIGSSMSEDSYRDGGGGGSFGMSVEGAKVKINELKQDKSFVSRLSGGDVDARAEWDRLHKIAYGG